MGGTVLLPLTVAAALRVEGHCVELPAPELSPKPCGPLSQRKYCRPHAQPQPLLRE